MKKIWFRAKRIDNDEYVEGYYVQLIDTYKDKQSERIYTGYSETECGDFYPDWFEVNPTTVQQYTGFLDSSDNPIFEGDEIEYAMDPHCPPVTGVVCFNCGNFEIKIDSVSEETYENNLFQILNSCYYLYVT